MVNPINIVLGVIIFALLGAVIYFLLFNKTRYKVRVRHLTGSKVLIKDDIGVEYKDKTGYSYIKLKKHKEKIPLPVDDDCVDLDHKGRRIIEVYRRSDGNYCYARDKGAGEFFEPVTTNMKIILADQIVKAKSKNNSMMQHLPMIIGLGFVVILVATGLILIGEPLNAIQEFTASSGNMILKAKQVDLEIVNGLKELKNDMQIVKATLDVPVAQEAPN